MDRKLRWGILSTAKIGGRVIPAIHESSNGEVLAVGSRDLERAQRFAAEMNIPRTYGSYEALIADPDIDAVYNPLRRRGQGGFVREAFRRRRRRGAAHGRRV
jgi:predicted dehydrogenase